MSAFGSEADLAQVIAWTSAFDPKRTLGPDFRTFQVKPKDLLGSPQQAEGAVD